MSLHEDAVPYPFWLDPQKNWVRCDKCGCRYNTATHSVCAICKARSADTGGRWGGMA